MHLQTAVKCLEDNNNQAGMPAKNGQINRSNLASIKELITIQTQFSVLIPSN